MCNTNESTSQYTDKSLEFFVVKLQERVAAACNDRISEAKRQAVYHASWWLKTYYAQCKITVDDTDYLRRLASQQSESFVIAYNYTCLIAENYTTREIYTVEACTAVLSRFTHFYPWLNILIKVYNLEFLDNDCANISAERIVIGHLNQIYRGSNPVDARVLASKYQLLDHLITRNPEPPMLFKYPDDQLREAIMHMEKYSSLDLLRECARQGDLRAIFECALTLLGVEKFKLLDYVREKCREEYTYKQEPLQKLCIKNRKVVYRRVATNTNTVPGCS